MKNLAYFLLILLVCACTKTPDIALPQVDHTFQTVDGPSSVVYIAAKDGMPVITGEAATGSSAYFWIDKTLPLTSITAQLKEGNRIGISNSTTGEISYKTYKSTIIGPNQFSRFYIKERPAEHMELLSVNVNFKHHDSITIDGTYVTADELLPFLEEYIAFAGEGKRTLIYLNFDQRLSLQQYLAKRLMVGKAEGPTVAIAKEEFVYDRKVVDSLIADCHCEL